MVRASFFRSVVRRIHAERVSSKSVAKDVQSGFYDRRGTSAADELRLTSYPFLPSLKVLTCGDQRERAGVHDASSAISVDD